MNRDEAKAWLDVANFFAFRGMGATASMVLEELQNRTGKKPYVRPTLERLAPSDPRVVALLEDVEGGR